MATDTLEKEKVLEPKAKAVKANDPKVNALIERANAARKRRMQAPVTVSSRDIRIPQKDMLRQIERRHRERGDAKLHSLFVPEDQLKEYADNGYFVELDESGDMVAYKGDVAMSCDESFYQEHLAQNKLRSKRKLRSAHRQARRDAPIGSEIEATEERDGKREDLLASDPFDN